ncbi:MAG: hypothetical protein H7301_04885 [Cryobacterium sp.]|nr:hypothetical protein [Oligoflexia bacterium]
MKKYRVSTALLLCTSFLATTVSYAKDPSQEPAPKKKTSVKAAAKGTLLHSSESPSSGSSTGGMVGASANLVMSPLTNTSGRELTPLFKANLEGGVAQHPLKPSTIIGIGNASVIGSADLGGKSIRTPIGATRFRPVLGVKASADAATIQNPALLLGGSAVTPRGEATLYVSPAASGFTDRVNELSGKVRSVGLNAEHQFGNRNRKGVSQGIILSGYASYGRLTEMGKRGMKAEKTSKVLLQTGTPPSSSVIRTTTTSPTEIVETVDTNIDCNGPFHQIVQNTTKLLQTERDGKGYVLQAGISATSQLGQRLTLTCGIGATRVATVVTEKNFTETLSKSVKNDQMTGQISVGYLLTKQ